MDKIKKILFLSANPKATGRLRLDEEVRDISEGIRRSKNRDQIEIDPFFATRLRDFHRALLDHEPDIVHFTGHGQKTGIILEDKMGMPVLYSAKALSHLFELMSDKVECVILSSCYSASQAKAISKHINYVIGMRKEIEDSAAIEFAVGFYDALGAGRTYEDAFHFGQSAIMGKFAESMQYKIPIFIDDKIKKERNSAKLNASPNNKPITLAIRSFKHSAHDIDKQVDDMLDLCPYFQDKKLVKGTWEDIRLKIIKFISRKIKAGNSYNLFLPLHSPLAFLVGSTIGPKCGSEINIYQEAISQPFELWKLKEIDTALKNPKEWTIEESASGNIGNELAAVLSVTRNIQSAVESYVKENESKTSRILHLEINNEGQHAIEDVTHAYKAAGQAIQIITDYSIKMKASKISFFIAAPNVFTFMLGQQSHFLGNITLYDFYPKDSVKYSPTLTL